MADPRSRGSRSGARSSAQSGGRPPRPRVVDQPRAAAYDVLKAVRVDGAYTNLVLPHVLREHGLTGRDAAFATELVSGTIRRQGTYDAILAQCVDRPLAKVEAKVLDALRLGAHQLLGMRVPTHAAISTTVDLVRAKVGQGPAGFTNAVLRRVASVEYDGWLRRIAPADETGRLSAWHSHPAWMVSALGEALAACGAGPDELEALLTADNESPSVVLVARPGRATPDELPGAPTVLSPYGVVSAGGDPASIPAVAEGRAGVQDEGSQLVALAAAAASVSGPDQAWLDLCAGPGGKAALLGALATERGAVLVANERQQHRSGLVRRSVGADALVVTGDGTRPPYAPASFDRVLVDAPCSGLGALRRRPESRWRRQPSDLDELVPLQEALLTSALSLVRPGGVVLYATCSPVLAETAGVVQAVLDARDDVALEPVPLDVPSAVGPLPGTVQLWPHRHRTDAMFLALLRRTR